MQRNPSTLLALGLPDHHLPRAGRHRHILEIERLALADPDRRVRQDRGDRRVARRAAPLDRAQQLDLLTVRQCPRRERRQLQPLDHGRDDPTRAVQRVDRRELQIHRRGRRPRTQPPALEIPQRMRARHPITQWIATDIACHDERHERPHRAQIRPPGRGTQRLTIQPLLIANQHRRPVRRGNRASPRGTLLVIRTHATTLHAAARPIIGTKGRSHVPITSIS